MNLPCLSVFLSRLVVVSWRPVHFEREMKKGVDPGERGCGGEELEGVVGWETLIGIVWKKNLFSIK